MNFHEKECDWFTVYTEMNQQHSRTERLIMVETVSSGKVFSKGRKGSAIFYKYQSDITNALKNPGHFSNRYIF